MKILIIDDEEDMRLIISVCLSAQGYDVQQATSGEEALQIARKDIPEVILMDYMMPDMDGATLMETFHSEDKFSNVKFIFLTAKTNPEILDGLLSRGAMGIIKKPFDPMTLGNQIVNILAG